MASERRLNAGELGAIFREYMQLDGRRKSDSLSVAQLERWSKLKHALNAHFQPGVRREKADRRDSVRIPVRMKVEFESYGEIRKSLMTNVSRGGLFIATGSPLPMGTALQISLQIEDTGQQVELSGEVVSQNTGPDLRREQAGMGIRFVNLSQSQQAAVEDLYRRTFRNAVEGGEARGAGKP